MEQQIQRIKQEQDALRHVKHENIKKQINNIYKQYGQRKESAFKNKIHVVSTAGADFENMG